MNSRWLMLVCFVVSACGGKVGGESSAVDNAHQDSGENAGSTSSNGASDSSQSAADLRTKTASITSLHFHPVDTSAEPNAHDETLDDATRAQDVFTQLLGPTAPSEIIPCEGYVRVAYYDVTFYAGSSVIAHLEVDPDPTCGAVALDDGESLEIGNTAKIATDLGFATADLFP